MLNLHIDSCRTTISHARSCSTFTEPLNLATHPVGSNVGWFGVSSITRAAQYCHVVGIPAQTHPATCTQQECWVWPPCAHPTCSEPLLVGLTRAQYSPAAHTTASVIPSSPALLGHAVHLRSKGTSHMLTHVRRTGMSLFCQCPVRASKRRASHARQRAIAAAGKTRDSTNWSCSS